jgi:hypothetical protein
MSKLRRVTLLGMALCVPCINAERHGWSTGTVLRPAKPPAPVNEHDRCHGKLLWHGHRLYCEAAR